MNLFNKLIELLKTILILKLLGRYSIFSSLYSFNHKRYLYTFFAEIKVTRSTSPTIDIGCLIKPINPTYAFNEMFLSITCPSWSFLFFIMFDKLVWMPVNCYLILNFNHCPIVLWNLFDLFLRRHLWKLQIVYILTFLIHFWLNLRNIIQIHF